MSGTALETHWSVSDIQQAIVRHTRNDESIPNVSFGFFKNTECDLVQVTGSSYLHEYEIKRSWGDFMADFKKKHFHDDIRTSQLTFVLPESFAGDRLKKFCADHYREFKRSFDFMFYMEGGGLCCMARSVPVQIDKWRVTHKPEERFRTETYITDEMAKVIRENDKDAPYRRHLFTEELARLYRLGVIRLWHRSPSELGLGDAGALAPVTGGAKRNALAEIDELACSAIRHISSDILPDEMQEISKLAKEALATPMRECDRFTDEKQADQLHAAFVEHCNKCDCPMGCDHRRNPKFLLDTNCASIMKCFAQFVLSRASGEDKDGKEDAK